MTAIPAWTLVALLMGPAPREQEPPTAGSRAADQAEIKRIAQELFDAVAPGDATVWTRHTDDSFVLTDEEGNVYDKRAFLAALRPLPTGYSGSLRVTEPVVRFFGDAAVLTHLALEEEMVFGQKLEARFRSTDTYVRRDGRWRLAASQIMVIPAPRHAGAVPPAAALDAYVGAYQLDPSVSYEVARRGEQLFGQRTGRAAEELLPALCADTFFRRGTWRGEKVFTRNGAGRVTHMIDRRDNRDLVWKRVR